MQMPDKIFENYTGELLHGKAKANKADALRYSI